MVVSDGGADILERGLCWNTTGEPTIKDKKVSCLKGLGEFIGGLTELIEGPTYYVRAYATNKKGTGYSQITRTFKICPKVFQVIHIEGLNGTPESKTVTYHSISSEMAGEARCWLTQNLGADRQAISAADVSNESAGWYWQFNRKQGYKMEKNIFVPINTWKPWLTDINESKDWESINDPCNTLLGMGWRLPTLTEWKAADAPP